LRQSDCIPPTSGLFLHVSHFEKDLFTKNITFQTTMDGRRQLRRYVPELDAEGVQDLPPEDLHRFAFKMATGSGKTSEITIQYGSARFASFARAERESIFALRTVLAMTVSIVCNHARCRVKSVK
jgi:hypothetical protein